MMWGWINYDMIFLSYPFNSIPLLKLQGCHMVLQDVIAFLKIFFPQNYPVLCFFCCNFACFKPVISWKFFFFVKCTCWLEFWVKRGHLEQLSFLLQGKTLCHQQRMFLEVFYILLLVMRKDWRYVCWHWFLNVS